MTNIAEIARDKAREAFLLVERWQEEHDQIPGQISPPYEQLAKIFTTALEEATADKEKLIDTLSVVAEIALDDETDRIQLGGGNWGPTCKWCKNPIDDLDYKRFCEREDCPGVKARTLIAEAKEVKRD